ncbi:MAG TPA: CopG family transcriptional regulator [Solirubrobacterales bacterium]|nr:CopG family transcriptional regulator [Solirubrobacterales bacterium]
MKRRKTYGRTPDGKLITEELVEELSRKAEAGYYVDEILERRRGRPAMGSGPASVESVRLDPELREALSCRAASDEESTSNVIRKALRLYLNL